MIKDLTERFVNQMIETTGVQNVTWEIGDTMGSKWLHIYWTATYSSRFHNQHDFIMFISGMINMQNIQKEEK